MKRRGRRPESFDPLQVQVGVRIKTKKGKRIRVSKEVLREIVEAYAEDPYSLPDQIEVYAIWWKNPVRKNSHLAKWKVATTDGSVAKRKINGEPVMDTGETPDYAAGTLSLSRLLQSGIVDVREMGAPRSHGGTKQSPAGLRSTRSPKSSGNPKPAKNSKAKPNAGRIPANPKGVARSNNTKGRAKPARNNRASGDSRK